MGREITITDTTLRDGQQSLWATRMTTPMMLPVAQHQERSGVGIVDIIGDPHYLAIVRFCREDPYDRMRALRKIISTPLIAGGIGTQMLGSFNIAPEDIRELYAQCSLRNGIDLLRAQQGLTDVNIIVENMLALKKLGARTILGLIYSVSPVHTNDFYETRLREILSRVDIDYIMIKDSGGLLTPEATGPLVDAIRRASGGRTVGLHSHCMTGLAPRVYMVGVEHGVDDLHCGIWPLALGTAQPSMQTTVRNLREEGYEVNVDDREIEAASAYLVELTRKTGFPVGTAQEYDHFHYRHQIPGGMATNLETQLRDAGLLHRLSEILEEIVVVRSELGWPTMVTPYSQFVANQALFNILTGERYKTVPDGVKMYVLGYYGKPLAPVDPDVLDRVLVSGSRDIELDLEKGRERMRRPMVPQLRKRFPDASDEELVLRYMCSDADIAGMLERRGQPAEEWADVGLNGSRWSRSLTSLLGQMAALNDVAHVVVEKDGLRLSVTK